MPSRSRIERIERAELGDFVVIEPAGRLVEQQQQRLGGERAGQFHALLGAEREARGRPPRQRFEADKGQHGARIVFQFALLAPARGQRHRVAKKAAAAAGVGADLDVVDDRHRGEQGRRLKGAPDAERGDVRRRGAVERPAVEPDVAAVRPVEPAQAIEQRGLAGAVRTDQADDAARGDGEAHVLERDDAAEAHGDVGDFQQRRISADFGASLGAVAGAGERIGRNFAHAGRTAIGLDPPRPRSPVFMPAGAAWRRRAGR